MTIDEIREKYIEFFKSRGHAHISAAPLVLENDPTTLFTSSGMQPLVPYLMGEKHPEGTRLVDSQPSIRTQDIEEVGDSRHTTFFEMLGNWSLGDYFKKEQLNWFWEFLTVELGLPKEKLWVTVFEGDEKLGVPRDTESADIWKEIGVAENKIYFYPAKENWWSRSGSPEKMPVGEIGGPDSEVFFEFDSVEHDPKFGEKCGPACDCGRFLEIGNSVFIQYKKNEDGSFERLPTDNLDFGGGLERLAAATINSPDVFKIDAFLSVIERIESITGKKYEENKRDFRIIADHMRAVVFLEYYGVEPSNKQQGYVMRRLIRRSALKMRNLLGSLDNPEIFNDIVDDYYVVYRNTEMFHERNVLPVEKLVADEVAKFTKSLEKGLREVEKIKEIDAKKAFDLYQTYGFPLEITEEIFEERGQTIDHDKFSKEFEKHQDLSRSASAGNFKGGLADHSEDTTKLHTVTHLLHESLRRVLGDHVQQKGSNITAERLRFDFVHDKALTSDEIKKVEDLINQQINNNLSVSMDTMSLEQADKAGALHFFDKKYDEQVNVYSIGDFSKEVCGGPHVNNTSDIAGHVTITKEKSASAGVRRIYAEIH